MLASRSALRSSWLARWAGIGALEYKSDPASTTSTGPAARASSTSLAVRATSPSGSVVQPHGPIWPRTSARAKTVKVGLGTGAKGSEPLVFTSDFEQQAASTTPA